MKIVGITGGIGSGKSKVMEFFAAKGYPCYSADAAGRRLLSEDQKVISAVIAAFGPAVVSPTMPLDRKKLAELVFKDKAQLQRLNAIIHPAVAEDFKAFLAQHKDSALVFKEAAILIESGSYTQCDVVLLVVSPKATRLARVQQRDAVSEAAVLRRMQNQWEDEKKIPYADVVLENTDWPTTEAQLEQLLTQLTATWM